MDESEFARKPNPFSVFAQPRRRAKQQFASTAKVLLLAMGLFGAITAAQLYLQRAKLADIMPGFSGRTTDQKIDDVKDRKQIGIESLPIIQQPQPIELAASTAASWTDWPPTASTPTLYRRGMSGVGSVDSVHASDLVLHQIANADRTDGVDDRSAARLLRPQFRPATSLIEQTSIRRSADAETTDYWMLQLASPSVFVRLGAVTELAKRGDRQSLDALHTHLEHEPDDKVRQSIIERLSR